MPSVFGGKRGKWALLGCAESPPNRVAAIEYRSRKSGHPCRNRFQPGDECGNIERPVHVVHRVHRNQCVSADTAQHAGECESGRQLTALRATGQIPTPMNAIVITAAIGTA